MLRENRSAKFVLSIRHSPVNQAVILSVVHLITLKWSTLKENVLQIVLVVTLVSHIMRATDMTSLRIQHDMRSASACSIRVAMDPSVLGAVATEMVDAPRR